MGVPPVGAQDSTSQSSPDRAPGDQEPGPRSSCPLRIRPDVFSRSTAPEQAQAARETGCGGFGRNGTRNRCRRRAAGVRRSREVGDGRRRRRQEGIKGRCVAAAQGLGPACHGRRDRVAPQGIRHPCRRALIGHRGRRGCPPGTQGLQRRNRHRTRSFAATSRTGKPRSSTWAKASRLTPSVNLRAAISSFLLSRLPGTASRKPGRIARQAREAGYACREANGNCVRTRQGMFRLKASRSVFIRRGPSDGLAGRPARA